jgi:hypothetical protein
LVYNLFMQNNELIQKNYNNNTNVYQLVLPVNLTV